MIFFFYGIIVVCSIKLRRKKTVMAQNRDQLQRIEIPGPGDIITSLSKKILASPKVI